MLASILKTLQSICLTLKDLNAIINEGYAFEYVEPDADVEAEDYTPPIQKHVTEREEAFDERIQRIHDELMKEEGEVGDAEIFHPGTYNLPNNHIYESPPPEEEYSI